MEDFAAKENKGIKEKSIYILHLDTPRIIIISSVMIGLIIISVLIGMNIIRQDKDTENFAHNDASIDSILADNSEKTNLLDANIDPALNNENALKNEQENPIASMENSFSIKPKEIYNNRQDVDNSIEKEQLRNATDVLAHENIESIIPPAKKISDAEVKKPRKKAESRQYDKVKESNKKKGIVEVSSHEKRNTEKIAAKNYFSIQVASFDRKSKATAEINNLENKKYNAYIDSARVNGKTFYRVMIGPIYSREKASDLLDEISSDNRYEESYIIKK